jgi:hypothetical protein
MLSNTDIAGELEALGKQARELAALVKQNGDLTARTLACGLVEVDKINQRLAKLAEKLNGKP